MRTHVVVGATLASREDSVVDTLLKVLGLVGILPEEDETGTGPTKRLVRRGRDDIAVLERIGELASGNETTGVRNVCHKERAVLIRGCPEGLVVPITRVRRCTADNETRLVDLCELLQAGVVDELGRGVKTIRKGLEVDGRRSHLLLSRL